MPRDKTAWYGSQIGQRKEADLQPQSFWGKISLPKFLSYKLLLNNSKSVIEAQTKLIQTQKQNKTNKTNKTKQKLIQKQTKTTETNKTKTDTKHSNTVIHLSYKDYFLSINCPIAYIKSHLIISSLWKNPLGSLPGCSSQRPGIFLYALSLASLQPIKQINNKFKAIVTVLVQAISCLNFCRSILAGLPAHSSIDPTSGTLRMFPFWSSPHGSAETNLASLHEEVGSIPGLTQWVKDSALLWAVVYVTDLARILNCCGYSVGG